MAARLLPYTCLRAKEQTRLLWQWVSFERGTIDIPPESDILKVRGRGHLIYLAPEALELLRTWHHRLGEPARGAIFPGARGRGWSGWVDPKCLWRVMHDLGAGMDEKMSAHGWRAIQDTLSTRHRLAQREIVDHAQAHADKRSTTRRAYDRHDYAPERRAFAEAWGELLQVMTTPVRWAAYASWRDEAAHRRRPGAPRAGFVEYLEAQAADGGRVAVKPRKLAGVTAQAANVYRAARTEVLKASSSDG